MISPCLKCSDRYLGCHMKCEQYKAYKDSLSEIKEKRDKDREFTRAILPIGKENIVREITRRKR